MKTHLAAALLLAGMAFGAHAECRGEVVRLHLDRKGIVSWNNDTFQNRQQMIDRFQREARAREQPKILFLPGPGVEPADGMAVLLDAQKAGLECISFSGVEQKRSD